MAFYTDGELALGRNVLVAFMPWNGYNFEDSILINERIVRDDVFTSIHIEEYEVMARDTKLGQEEISRDIPNVGEEALKNLDEAGIVTLVPRLRPWRYSGRQSDTKRRKPDDTGRKAACVPSLVKRPLMFVILLLRVPPGATGTVVEVRVFSRRGLEKDERARAIERAEIERLAKDRDDEQAILEGGYMGRVTKLLTGQTVASAVQKMRQQIPN